MAYVPVVSGETSEFRGDIEDVLGGGEAVRDRIEMLSERTRERHLDVTFGAEIECEFTPDPCSPVAPEVVDSDHIYREIVGKFQDYDSSDAWKKGAIIPHHLVDDKIIVVHTGEDGKHKWDQGDESLIEIRTAPALGGEAIERYWQLVNAIGVVASENGLLALLHSSHISSVARDSAIWHSAHALDNHHASSRKYVAGVQHNLEAVRALQLDAGLERGLSIIEAFPTKDASTVIYDNRIEHKHPLIGVVDPRVDVMATLAAANQALDGEVSDQAIDNLLTGYRLRFDTDYEPLRSLQGLVLADRRDGQLIMASQMESSAWNAAFRADIDTLVFDATAGEYRSHDAEEGDILKDIVRSLVVEGKELKVRPGSRYYNRYGGLLREHCDGVETSLVTDVYYTEPQAIFDSPHTHAQRRTDALQSSDVRYIFDDVTERLTDSRTAITRRQKIIANNMIMT